MVSIFDITNLYTAHVPIQSKKGLRYNSVGCHYQSQFFIRVLSPIFLGFFRVLEPVFSVFLKVPGPIFQFFEGSTRVSGPGFPVLLGTCQGPIRALGPGFPVFVGSHQCPGCRFSGFCMAPLESHQGTVSRFSSFLGSWVPVFWYAVNILNI